MCTNDLIVFHPLGIFSFVFSFFLVRKIPFDGIELTSQRVRGLRGTSELPGRPAYNYIKSSVSIIDTPANRRSNTNYTFEETGRGSCGFSIDVSLFTRSSKKYSRCSCYVS